MESHYEINVIKDGQHFFATAPRSCNDKQRVLKVLKEIQARFPESDGFEVQVSYYKCSGYMLKPEEVESFDPWADDDDEE